MKEARNLPLDLQVETLTISRRNILEQLMRVPRRGWQSLIRDVHFGKAGVTCKVSDPSFTNFNQRRSSFLVATSPLSILITEDPASFVNFHQRKYSFLMVKSAIKRRITALCRRKIFRVQLVWLITLKVGRTTCMPLEQRFVV